MYCLTSCLGNVRHNECAVQKIPLVTSDPLGFRISQLLHDAVPPPRKICPLDKLTAQWPDRLDYGVPVLTTPPALSRILHVPGEAVPPTTRTLPSVNNVAEWRLLLAHREPELTSPPVLFRIYKLLGVDVPPTISCFRY